ncbi:MAG: hypothetical protein DRP45_00925 [Candidatus Zixiibacteriota bacterium]|nr:MAG: hypothetical protein DRP45_00925 [candidate division Zixibacteria bacterium]
MKAKLDLYKRVFGSDDGKAVLADMAVECGLLSTHVQGKTIDPNYITFKEGERNAVLRIITALEYDLNDFRELAKPNRSVT